MTTGRGHSAGTYSAKPFSFGLDLIYHLFRSRDILVCPGRYWLLYPAILTSSFFSAGDGGVLLGLLPLSATLLSVAARHQTDLFLLRLGTMLSAIPWLPYSWMVGSYSNVVGMCVFLALSGGALVRFHLLAQPPERHAAGIATAQGVPWQPGQQTRLTVTGVWLVETGDEAGKRA